MARTRRTPACYDTVRRLFPACSLWSAIILWIVALLTALLSFHEESKALSGMESLKGLISQQSTVIREGAKDRIPSTEIVVGDLVYLTLGDKVCLHSNNSSPSNHL